MMSYGKTLRRYLDEFFDSFSTPMWDKRLRPNIEGFLAEPSKDNAQKVYEVALNTYTDQVTDQMLNPVPGISPSLRPLFRQLRKFEEQVAPTIPQHRDHYVHSIRVFLLGMAMYQRSRSFREAAAKAFAYPDSYPSYEEEFFHRWGLAALFHDIGYPVEIAYESIREYSRFAMMPGPALFDSTSEQKPAPKIPYPIFSLATERLDSLLYVNQLWPDPKKESKFFDQYPDYKASLSTDILVLLAGNLTRRLKVFGRETAAKMLRDHVVQGMTRGKVDHGFLSATILLKWIGILYRQSGWNPAYFYHSVVDAAAAILLHNVYERFLMKYPFDLQPLAASDHPLGYLLILCDHLQETDRPEYGFYAKERPPTLTAESLSISDSEFVMQFAARKPGTPFEGVSLAVERCEETIRRVLDVDCLFETFHLKAQNPSM